MKSVMLLGILLLVVGGLVLGYQGFTYTTREKVIDLGPVHVTAEKEKTVALPPILGAVALGTGIALLALGARRT